MKKGKPRDVKTKKQIKFIKKDQRKAEKKFYSMASEGSSKGGY